MGDTFLYVSPIYLQATQARMPQLKKVVLAVGNRLIYADTYEEALAQLEPARRLGTGAAAVRTAESAASGSAGAAADAAPKSSDPRIESIRQHLQRYRDLDEPG